METLTDRKIGFLYYGVQRKVGVKMSTGHTPGPWEAVNLNRRPVVYMGRQGHGVSMPVAPHAEQKANARLIAAAPKMLEALQASIRAAGAFHLGEGDHMDAIQEAADEARAAIALATAEA